MAISFFTQSKKDYSPITVRYTDAVSDAKARTPLFIKNGRLKKGIVIRYKAKQSQSANEKQNIIDKNISLDKVELEMQKIKRLIYDAINDLPIKGQITSKWLKRIVNQSDELYLNDHILLWLDSKRSLSENSIKSANAFYNNIKKNFGTKMPNTSPEEYIMDDIKLTDIDLKYFDYFKNKLGQSNYSNRTINSYLGYLMNVLDYAEDRGYKINYKRSKVKKLKIKKAIKSYLTFEDLERIANLNIKNTGLKVKNELLEIARDRLILSCYAALRSSDLFKLSNKNIQKEYIVYRQKKTDSNDIYIPITPPIRKIIDKYDGIPLIDRLKTFNTWSLQYSRHIKKIGKLAGIDGLVDKKMYKSNQIIQTEKFNTMITHIGRMSFATNFYGKIKTSDIISVTGHSSESQLLTYINKNRIVNNDDLKDEMTKVIEKLTKEAKIQ